MCTNERIQQTQLFTVPETLISMQENLHTESLENTTT